MANITIEKHLGILINIFLFAIIYSQCVSIFLSTNSLSWHKKASTRIREALPKHFLLQMFNHLVQLVFHCRFFSPSEIVASIPKALYPIIYSPCVIFLGRKIFFRHNYFSQHFFLRINVFSTTFMKLFSYDEIVNNNLSACKIFLKIETSFFGISLLFWY